MTSGEVALAKFDVKWMNEMNRIDVDGNRKLSRPEVYDHVKQDFEKIAAKNDPRTKASKIDTASITYNIFSKKDTNNDGFITAMYET